MTRFRAFSPSQRLLRTLTAAVAVASAPALVHAQSATRRPPPNDDNAPAAVSAEEMRGSPDRLLILEGNVEIERGSLKVEAERATYNVPEDEIEATGGVRIRRLCDQYTGDELRLKLDAKEGYVLRPTYKLELNNAQGRAERINFEGEDRATIYAGTYTSCDGPTPDWYLKSSRLTLDRARDEGTSYGTVVYFKGVPILAAPAMSFPISDARKTGVLPPTIGSTNNGGLEVTVPYYLNVAPNRDLTLYPKLYSRRGLQLGAEARYLGESYSGQTRVEYLPDDRLRNMNRYAVTSTHQQQLTPALRFSWNLNAASDDNYPTDFARTITTSVQRLLFRDVIWNYAGSFWNAAARVSNFQVLQDPLAPIVRPYSRLPQLTLNAGRYDVFGFDWNVDAEMTRFSHPLLQEGERLVVQPRLAFPIIAPGYFVTPRVSLHASQYQLDTATAGAPRSLDRVVPTFSVDGGMVFEREASFFGQRSVQTLEPRLFYVRTPYRDQSAFPTFDTAEADLSFAQLFLENRFIGNDRISDANQLTAALISRYLDMNGAERMRLALGQRFHFTDQRVTLGPTRDESRSDILASVYGQLLPQVGIESNVQYSQTLGALARANYGVRWNPAPMKVLNLQYRRDFRNNLEQVDVSSQWPIALRWYGVGRINYSLPDSKVAEGLLGFEYKEDCWVFRTVAQRTPTAAGRTTTSLFFQLELSGLTRVGSNPLQALRANIPGYQLISETRP